MRDLWKTLTPEERKAVFILRRKVIEEREAAFYAIHGQKKGRPKDAPQGKRSDVRQVSGRN